MTERKPNPRAALDYPNLADDLFVIWFGNEHVWPDARRSLSYLSGHSRHPGGWALYTRDAELAAQFATEPEAREWLAEQEAARKETYGPLEITTVATLKARRFPVEG